MAFYTESKLITGTYSLSRVHRRTYSSYLHQVSIVNLLKYFQSEDEVNNGGLQILTGTLISGGAVKPGVLYPSMYTATSDCT